MESLDEYSEYQAALRQGVCSHCIERKPGCPPCTPQGKACGVELHAPQLVEICKATDSVLIEPYAQQLQDVICADCEYRDGPNCPCPLDYLLPLVVETVERVQLRNGMLNTN